MCTETEKGRIKIDTDLALPFRREPGEKMSVSGGQ